MLIFFTSTSRFKSKVMSCNNFKFIKYPNLSKRIEDKYSNNNLEKNELFSLINDWVKDENVSYDIESNVDKAIEDLENYKKTISNDTKDSLSSKLIKLDGSFSNSIVKEAALTFVEKFFVRSYFVNYKSGGSTKFKNVYAMTRKNINNFVKDRLSRTSDPILVKNLNDLADAVGRYNEETKVYARPNEEFVRSLVTTPDVAKLIHFDDVNKFFAKEEAMTDETDFIDYPDGTEENVDDFTGNSLWSIGIGQKADFRDNIRDIVGFHIQVLPSRFSPDAKGSINFGDNFQEPLFMDAKFISTILFDNIVDKSTPQTFLNSIEYIAKTNSSAYGLMALVEDLKQNPLLLYAYYSVFNKPTVDRVKVDVIDIPTIEHVNVNSDIRKALSNLFFEGLQTAVAKNRFTAKAYKKDEFGNKVLRDKVFITTDDKPAINKLLDYFLDDETALIDIYNNASPEIYYDIFKQFIPDITLEEYKTAYTQNNEFNAKAARGGIILFASYTATNRENYDGSKETLNIINENFEGKVKNAAAKKVLKNLREAINNSNSDGVYKIVSRFEKFLVKNVSKNSLNVEGKQVSDVLNRNYAYNLYERLLNRNNAKSYIENKMLIAKNRENTLLVEDKQEGLMPIYGIFRRTGNTYEKTTYGSALYNISLLDGITANENAATYNDMTDNDYLLTSIGLFNGHYKFYTFADAPDLRIANYLLYVPSDSKHNFQVTAPRYSIYDYSYKDGINGKRTKVINYNKSLIKKDNTINKEHPIYRQLEAIARKEMISMGTALQQLFIIEYKDGKGKIAKKNGQYICYNDKTIEENLEENPRFLDKFYKKYHYNGDELIDKNTGELTGNVFKFNRLGADNTPNSNAIIRELNSSLDFLTGDGEVLLEDGSIELSEHNQELLTSFLNNFLQEYLKNSLAFIKENYSDILVDVQGKPFSDEFIQEWLVNTYMVMDNLFDIINGEIPFFKNPQEILKRIKQVQGSGDTYALGSNIDDANSELVEVPLKIMQSDARGNKSLKPIFIDKIIDGKVVKSEVKLRNKFYAVTIANTRKTSSDDAIKNIEAQIEAGNLGKDAEEEILAPHKQVEPMNDAQSYITWEEWIRRTAGIGELEKYASLIDQINPIVNKAINGEDVTIDIAQINWENIPNRVQIQKNFYYDLYLDNEVKVEAPRQVKNAEFVLIPGFIGQDLQYLYDIMVENGIDQVNTVETTKVAQHNVLTFWDNEGSIRDKDGRLSKNVEDFANLSGTYKEAYTYNNLQRQQVVPQHMEDTYNKLGKQITKIITDNVSNERLKPVIDKLIDNIVGQVKEANKNICEELGIELDKNGDVIIDENGSIKGLNYETLFAMFKENAYRTGMPAHMLAYFDTDETGMPKYPLFMSNMQTKVENVINGIINRNITRTLSNGFHAAQLSDFGFGKNLRYRVISKTKTADGKELTVYELEVYVTRWSKKFNGWKVENIDEEIKTFLGYRIPTEGKQSIAIMKPVPYPYTDDGFFPDIYGSTIVVPHEWLVQTDSDYDVDSVYAIVKAFGTSIDALGEPKMFQYSNDRYSKEENEDKNFEKYINYLNDNAKQLVAKRLNETYDKSKPISEFRQDLINEINSERMDIELGLSKDSTFLSYEDFKKLQEETNPESFESRNNAILDAMIEILSSPEAFHESLLTSNFDDISDVVNKLEETAREVAPNDFITQLKQKTDATAGNTLKGIYVNLRAFNSISNLVKGTTKPLSVYYAPSVISLEEARKRFGYNNVEEVTITDPLDKTIKYPNYIKVKHLAVGWSLDNKNVEGKFITYYQSQLVAHILDVMKSGSTRNENIFTAFGISAMASMGINYDTIIKFLYQPAVSTAVKYWKRAQSVVVTEDINPIAKALEELIRKIDKNYNKNNNYKNLQTLIKDLDAKLISKNIDFKETFGISLKDLFEKENITVLPKEILERRLKTKDNDINSIAIDAYNLGALKYIINIGDNINNAYNDLNTDGYGAKKSFYETYNKIKNYLVDEVNNGNIDVVSQGIYQGVIKEVAGNKTIGYATIGKSKSRQRLIFNIIKYGSLKDLLTANIDDSSYKTAAAYFKYATAFSLMLGNQLMPTTNIKFMGDALSINNWTKRNITESEYTAISKSIIHKYIAGAFGSPFLTMPITLNVDGSIIVSSDIVEQDKNGVDQIIEPAVQRNIELCRVVGAGISSKIDFTVEDFNNPTLEEIDKFSKLSPAQKVVYLRDTIGLIGLPQYISTSFYDRRLDNFSAKYHKMYVRTTKLSDSDLHNLFVQMWISSNPLIRLTAIDIAKYVYLVEGNREGYTKLGKVVGVEPLDSYNEGGMSIGDSAINTINNLFNVEYRSEITNPTLSLYNKLSYVRTNYDTFSASYVNLKKLNLYKSKFKSYQAFSPKLELREVLGKKVYVISDDYFMKILKEVNNGKNIYKFQGELYFVTRMNDIIQKEIVQEEVDKQIVSVDTPILVFCKLNKLEEFESSKTIENSINPNYNTYSNLAIQLSDAFSDFKEGEINTSFFVNLSDYVKNLKNVKQIGEETEDSALMQELPKSLQHDVEVLTKNFITLDNRVFNLKENTFYAFKDEKENQYVYFAVDAKKAKTNKFFKNYQPSMTDNAIILVRTMATQVEKLKPTEGQDPNTQERYSSFENTLAKPIKSILERAQQDAVRRNHSSERVVKALKLAGINLNDITSIEDNANFVISQIAELIRNEANVIEKDIEQFAVIGVDENNNPVYGAIDNDLIINEVIKNRELENRFLSLLNDARSLRNKYKPLIDAPIESLNPDDREVLQDLKDRLNKISSNGRVLVARKNYYTKLILKYSHNPNYDMQLMDTFDFWNDTSKLDYLFQDIRSNKNPLIQLVLKRVMGIVESGRLNGLDEFDNFRKELERIKKEAARKGEIVDIDSLVDENGVFVTPYNEKYKEDREKLEKNLILAKNINGINSIEYWKAVYNLNKFKVTYEENRTLPSSVEIKLFGTKRKLEGTLDEILLKLESLVLEKGPELLTNNGEPEKAKQLLDGYVSLKYHRAAIAKLNRDTNGIFTSQQQEEFDNHLKEINRILNEEDEPGELTIVSEILSDYKSAITKINDVFKTQEEKSAFENELKHNLAILEKYETYNEYGLRIDNVEYLMQHKADFRRAYTWIRNNAVFKYDVVLSTKIQQAYDVLRDVRSRNIKNTLNNFRSQYSDIYGVFNGYKFSQEHPEEVAKIKEEQIRRYREFDSSGNPFGGFIRNKPAEPTIYKKEFYEGLRGSNEAVVHSQSYIDTVNSINAILIKYYDYENGRLMTTRISEKDLKILEMLFDNLRDDYNANIDRDFMAANATISYDSSYDEDAKLVKGRGYYEDLWKRVFTVVYNGEVKPRTEIYGIIKPKDDSFIDKEKTDAVRLLNKHTRETTSLYYWKKYNSFADKDSEEFKKWKKENHFFDPYSGRIKPIRIWTYTQYLDDSGKVSGKYEPRKNQVNFNIKEDLVNPNYSTVGVAKFNPNHKGETKYNNSKYYSLNSSQKELMNYLRNVMKRYAYTIGDRRFIDEGYLPSATFDKPLTAEEMGKQTMKSFGWYWQNISNEDYGTIDQTSWENDFEISNSLFKKLIDGQTEKFIPTPEKAESETEEQYRKRLDDANKKNAEIREKLRKDHANLLNHNWEEVFKSLIVNGERYNAVRNVKAMLFNLSGVIDDIPAKRTIGGQVVHKVNSEEAQDISQTNTSAALKLFMRRLLYNKYKEKSSKALQQLGSLAQNISGTKYMAMNIQGGIANIITGADNIMMERLAGQYVDFKIWEKAKLIWLANVPKFLRGMYNEDGVGLVDAIIKRSAIVDYDRFVEITSSEGTRLAFKRFRNLLFSPQNAGEHFMQNTMLIAMMMSNKIIQNDNGEWEIQNRNLYARGAEEKAIREILEDNQDLLATYNQYIEDIKKNEQAKFTFNTFRDDVNGRFVRRHFSLVDQKRYANLKEKYKKEKYKEFDDNTNSVFDAFQYVDGKLSIKEESHLTNEMYGQFIDKVRQVNNKVHGVYNALGAAAIERYWWGGMVMQYHKHLYPGFKKRWRWNGYYNETLDTVEKGAYKSFWDFVTTPIRDNNMKIREENENPGILDFLKGLQNFCKEFINFYLHVVTNYRILPEYEKANIRRCIPDFAWQLAGLAASIALYGLMRKTDWDEDDILYNLLMYEADRMVTEASAFERGAINEFGVLWSSPLAIAQTFKDMYSTLALVTDAVVKSDVNWEYQSGKFAHQNKLGVYLKRNIPVYRVYYNLKTLPKNNKFYKVKRNLLGLVPYKDIALDLFNIE